MTTGVLFVGPRTERQDPRPGSDVTVLWSTYPTASDNGSVISLPMIVEERQHLLRSAYLSWLRSIPATPTRHGTIDEQLRIRPDLSYWWLSLPGEFPFSEDSPILPTVKMLALESVCHDLEVTQLDVVGGSGSVQEALRRWASNTNRKISFDSPTRNLSDTRAALRAGATAAKYLVTRGLRRRRSSQIGPPPRANAVAMVDYLGSQESASLQSGSFQSRYWGPLVDLLDAMGGATWLHRRVSGTPWPRASHRDHMAGRGTHLDATELTGPRARLRGLLDYVRVSSRALGIVRTPELFVISGTGVDAWPLVRTTWMRCFLGANALHNLMWLASIEERLAAIPRQRLGIYLMESQPWELSLISAWRRSGHGSLVGFAHSTVRSWDLRYALVAQAVAIHSAMSPTPDRIAVNGPAARETMLDFGTPEDLLVDVEAVRFMPDPIQVAGPGAQPTRGKLMVLILGEYWPAAAEHQLRILEDIDPLILESTEFVFRPHPAGVLTPRVATHIQLSPPGCSLADEVRLCHALLVGETSTVAIEALASGKPVAILGDPGVLPTNPLRGVHDSPIVRSQEDLVSWLTSEAKEPSPSHGAAVVTGHVNTVGNLKSWKSILR